MGVPVDLCLVWDDSPYQLPFVVRSLQGCKKLSRYTMADVRYGVLTVMSIKWLVTVMAKPMTLSPSFAQ